MFVAFFEGPDGCGKTELSTQFSAETGFKRFKVETEKENWMNGTFKNSLSFDALLPSFARQLDLSFVCDRGYASEWVYSRVFGRETDENLLRTIDDKWAELGAFHVILLRRSYESVRPDDLVEPSFLQKLNDEYLQFIEWTNTEVVGLYVDDFLENGVFNSDAQLKEIYAGLEAYKLRRRYPRVYEIIKAGDI